MNGQFSLGKVHFTSSILPLLNDSSSKSQRPSHKEKLSGTTSKNKQRSTRERYTRGINNIWLKF